MCVYACVRVNLGVQEDVVKSHLIIIIKPEVSTFLFVVIFFRGCVCMYIYRESWIFYSFITLQFYDERN